MQLLADAVDTYEETALARWWEWESASDGRRQLTWSTGRRDLRALAGLGWEATDEEIADEDQEADIRLGLTAETWEWLRTTGRATELLDVAEHDDLDGARTWSRQQRHGWVEARPSRTGPPPEVVQPYGWRADAQALLSSARASSRSQNPATGPDSAPSKGAHE